MPVIYYPYLDLITIAWCAIAYHLYCFEFALKLVSPEDKKERVIQSVGGLFTFGLLLGLTLFYQLSDWVFYEREQFVTSLALPAGVAWINCIAMWRFDRRKAETETEYPWRGTIVSLAVAISFYCVVRSQSQMYLTHHITQMHLLWTAIVVQLAMMLLSLRLHQLNPGWLRRLRTFTFLAWAIAALHFLATCAIPNF